MKNHRGHIVILVENLPVPFDRRVWMESLTLTQAGYKVSVISPCPPDETDRPDRNIEGVSVYRYPMPAPTQSKFSFVREFAYCLWQTGLKLRQVWRDVPFDVIQTCNPPDTFWVLALPYKRLGVKFVFDHHDLCPELYESKFGRRDALWKALMWLERRQFATADHVIATNESYRRVAIERGGKTPQQVTVVRSGPLLSRFKPVPADPALKRGRKHLGVYLGVMGPQDGVDAAVRAVKHAVDGGLRDTAFAFIGAGDCYDEVVSLAESLGLADLIEFPGRVSDLTLRTYLSTADFGIAPDPRNPLNDKSTMNKIVEYMAMGLPIVSFDLEETRQSAGEAAIYIADDDEAAMGRAIIDLVNDPRRREYMAQVGFSRMRGGLSWSSSAESLVRVYDRLLHQKRVEESIEPLLERLGAEDDAAAVALAAEPATSAV